MKHIAHVTKVKPALAVGPGFGGKVEMGDWVDWLSGLLFGWWTSPKQEA